MNNTIKHRINIKGKVVIIWIIIRELKKPVSRAFKLNHGASGSKNDQLRYRGWLGKNKINRGGLV